MSVLFRALQKGHQKVNHATEGTSPADNGGMSPQDPARRAASLLIGETYRPHRRSGRLITPVLMVTSTFIAIGLLGGAIWWASKEPANFMATGNVPIIADTNTDNLTEPQTQPQTATLASEEKPAIANQTDTTHSALPPPMVTPEENPEENISQQTADSGIPATSPASLPETLPTIPPKTLSDVATTPDPAIAATEAQASTVAMPEPKNDMAVIAPPLPEAKPALTESAPLLPPPAPIEPSASRKSESPTPNSGFSLSEMPDDSVKSEFGEEITISVEPAQGVAVKPSGLKQLQTAENALMNGNALESVRLYRAILAKSPDNMTARAGLANAYRVSGNVAGAKNTYQEILQQDPDNHAALTNLIGLIGKDANDSDLAVLSRFTNASHSAPASAQIAQIYASRGQYAAAISHAKLAARLAPDDMRLRYNLAVLLDKAGDRQRANLAYVETLEGVALQGGDVAGVPVEQIKKRVSWLAQ